jgi:hypothetical protein
MSPRMPKDYNSPFRHSSSVRALQMNDEVISDTHSVLHHHRRSGSQMSAYSQRSAYSSSTSPTKRSSRSNRGSPQKSGSGLRKEFPLVLLHCTLLTPNHRLKYSATDEALVVELLPEKYRERWIALREKLADVEVSSRGVLINHPREDYARLEESLLESLDLEQPRLRDDHYIPSSESGTDSGFESSSTTEEDAAAEGTTHANCPDCGCPLKSELLDRKWEVKVFAANGLLRGPAWAAAWQEMEKVDVEINVWLPEDVRRELEAKLALLEVPADDALTHEPLEDDTLKQAEPLSARDREVYGESGPSEHEVPPWRIPSPYGSTNKSDLGLGGLFVSREKSYFLLGIISAAVLFLAATLMCSSLAVPPTSAAGTVESSSASVHVSFVTVTSTTTSVATFSPITEATMSSEPSAEMTVPFIGQSEEEGGEPQGIEAVPIHEAVDELHLDAIEASKEVIGEPLENARSTSSDHN